MTIPPANLLDTRPDSMPMLLPTFRCQSLHPTAIFLLSILATGSSSYGQGTSPSQIEADKLAFFETEIRPALLEHCVDCHARNTEASGGLLLDSFEGWARGGDSGEAIIPGSPGESRLLKAVRYDDPKLQMPPDAKLPQPVIEAFETWIANGAVDPRFETGAEAGEGGAPQGAFKRSDPAEYWSYQPIHYPELPLESSKQNSNSIDRFIVDRLKPTGISPAGSAARRDQVRRLYFDLSGLPPAAEILFEFEHVQDFETAYEQLVDHLLASPQFGEAFARHWMDVARYAESVTLRGLMFKQAWRYRDYLVQSFHEDRPFNQMIVEQLAGDLLQAESREERARQLVATGFLAMGDTNFEKQDKQQLDMDYVDEQLDVIGQAFLGQTIGCARCHDHKFDPIPTSDYYAMAGILKSASAMRHANVSSCIDQPLPLPPDVEQHFAAMEGELQQLTTELASTKKKLASITKAYNESRENQGSQPSIDPSSSPENAADSSETGNNVDSDTESQMKAMAEGVKSMESRMQLLQTQVDQRPKYLTVVEESPPVDLAIHIRGDVHNLGNVVPRGFLTAVKLRNEIEIPDQSSGRLQMAHWIAADDNPLTARVYANRVWGWLIGQGLVDTPNNFGTTGSAPTHPELLDWLAMELIRNQWSTKHLVRTIVMSESYRRAISPASELAQQVDPDNRLYWSGQKRRLSVEELRDAMLSASGELDLQVGGTLIGPQTKSDYNFQHASTRRSIYQPLFRNSLPDLFTAFDYPDSSISSGQRPRSTVSTQALALVNGGWVQQRAKSMAEQIMAESQLHDPENWIRSAFLRCYQRTPSAEELTICLEFFEPRDTSKHASQLERLSHTLFASIDFRYLQ